MYSICVSSTSELRWKPAHLLSRLGLIHTLCWGEGGLPLDKRYPEFVLGDHLHGWHVCDWTTWPG